MAWVAVHQQLRDHRKLRDLYRRLKISRQEAIGILVLLWMWALDNADRSGKLLNTTREDIAEAAMWKGDPDVLYSALVESRWLDVEEEDIYIHDWDEFNKPYFDYLDKKEKDRQRKRGSKKEDNASEFPPKFRGNSVDNPPEDSMEFHASHSPSHYINKEREINAHACDDIDNISDDISQKFDTEIQKINDKSFEYGMNGITPEFMDDAEARLKDGTDPDLIVKALSIAATKASGGSGARCRYAISVLQSWAAKGIKTLAQWEAKNTPSLPRARDKPMKTKAQEREEAFQKSKEEAYRKLREQGVVLDDAR